MAKPASWPMRFSRAASACSPRRDWVHLSKRAAKCSGLRTATAHIGGLPHRAKLESYSLASYKDWFLAQSKYAPMDVTIVGDLPVDEAVAIAAGTIGALPPLQAAPDTEKFRTLPFPRKPVDFTWNVEQTKSKSGYVELYWPLQKPVSGAGQVRLGLMMDILSDRLRVSIRQEMGKTYAPATTVDLFRDFHDYGWLNCQIEAAPADIKRVQKAVLEQVARLANKGATPDELQRAQQVQLADRERQQQTNSYWLSTLDTAARYPAAAEIRDHGAEIISRTTLADIDALAREYLRADQVSAFRIVPKESPRK